MINDADFLEATSLSTEAAGKLYRDMGGEIVTRNSENMHTAIYRLVQPVDGSSTEGVPDSFDTYYVRTWAANPSMNPVSIVRTG